MNHHWMIIAKGKGGHVPWVHTSGSAKSTYSVPLDGFCTPPSVESFILGPKFNLIITKLSVYLCKFSCVKN